MDGEAIYSALLSHASIAQLSSSPTSSLSTTIPVTTTAAVYGDDRSERIYQALVAAAESSNSLRSTNLIAPTGSTPDSTLLPSKLTALASSSNGVTATNVDYPGFLTSRLSSLPSPTSILLGVFLITLSIVGLIAGARSLYFGRDLGRTYGSNERKGWLRGGVGGVFFGSTALGLLVTLLTLFIVSRQNEASLGSWATLSIIVLCSSPGAIAGGRWAWVSRSSVALIGSTSLSLLLIVSFHISSFLTRIILTIVFLVLSLLVIHLRFTQRFAIPILSALSSSFLLVLAIDIFVHLGFIDSLGLLVKSNGVGSGGGEAKELVVEKGLIAGWWILSIASAGWQTWWGLGIEGQELWDDYLARYLPTLDPLGTHLPPLSFTDRIRSLFSSKRKTSNRHEIFTKLSQRTNRRTTPWDDIDDEEEGDDEFDYEKGLARVKSERRIRKRGEGSDTWDSEVETLASRKKPQRSANPRNGSSKPAQYGAVSSSDEEEQEEEGEGGGIWSVGKGMDSKSTRSFGALSGSTLATGLERRGGENEFEKATRAISNTSSPTTTTNQNHSSPAFSSRDRHLDRLEEADRATSKRGSLLGRLFRHSTSSSLSPSSPYRPEFNPNNDSERKMNSVPATPSLITAIERVNAAQRQAREQRLHLPELERIDSQATQVDSVEDRRSRRASMDEFWKSVVEKASS
ncbi:hypothetical protein JCM3765_003690 [Sporobolomyces pararoseus]